MEAFSKHIWGKCYILKFGILRNVTTRKAKNENKEESRGQNGDLFCLMQNEDRKASSLRALGVWFSEH